MAITIEPTEQQKQSEFAKLFKKQEGQASVEEGSMVEGRIVQINDKFAIVDIGYKSEGQIPVSEFKDSQGNLTIKIGDRVDVLLENIEDEEGMLRLSKERADTFRAWDILVKAFEEGESVEGLVIGKIKGGLVVDVGVKAFLPGSQIDFRPARNLDRYVGKSYRFKILKLNKRRGNIVLSRKEAMGKESEGTKEAALKQIQEGQLIEGAIKNITEYGVFVDLGGIDGLLHVTDMSWGRVSHPSDLFSVGNTIQVVVLKIDEASQRVSLGYKQLQADPWQKVEGQFPVGSKIKGKVVSLADYGIFVSLAPGIEGLVHISEISWNKKLRHPSQVVNAGEEVEAIVLDCDVAARRIALGMKQLQPNPWDSLEKDCPVGSKVKGRVRNLTDFGLFLDCGVGIDGLIHISDLAWVQNFSRADEVFHRGDTLEAVVLHCDRNEERFSLSLRQLQPNPWETILANYPKGEEIKGKIEALNSAGAVIHLTKGVSGLILKPPAEWKVGDKVTATIETVDQENRKFHLKPSA